MYALDELVNTYKTKQQDAEMLLTSKINKLIENAFVWYININMMFLYFAAPLCFVSQWLLELWQKS